MNLRTAVENWLKCHGYDGLYHADTECGCKLGDLMPCDEPSPNCEAGYLGSFVLGHSGYAFGGKEAFRICAHKPAERFADAEEPRVEERTLRSPDGSFVMTVWPKDDPPRIEARIVQQPEEWRKARSLDPIIRVIEQADGRFWATSSALPALNLDGLFLRGYETGSDNCQMRCVFMLPAKRDAYLAKLEATVAAMPRLADQFKVDDGVVMAGQMCETARSVAPAVGFRGTIHWISKDSEQGGIADIIADGGELVCAYLINLRHERDDERPAEVTISGDEAVAVMNPDPRRANFPPTRYGANGLPIFEPKPEPPPVHMTVALVGGRIQVNLDPVEGGGA